MPIPDFQSLMVPLLGSLRDGVPHSTQETIDAVAAAIGLTAAEVDEPMPSGKGPLFTNRLAWAKLHLKRAGLVASDRRGVYRITDRGRQVLADAPERITLKYLTRYPEYAEFRNRSRTPLEQSSNSASSGDVDAERTPEEYLEYGYSRLRAALAEEILSRVAAMSPAFFENLVVDLLLAMGYGGSQRDAGRAVGRGGDEGIDGVIKQDRLGLETVYVQAKRWQGTVGRPEIQRFAGALQGQRARKGVFITTSDYTREAQAYAASIDATIVLVNGTQLAELMIDHGIGVTPVCTYEIKRIDSDYFSPE